MSIVYGAHALRALSRIHLRETVARIPLDQDRRNACAVDVQKFIRTYFPYMRTLNRFQSSFAKEMQDLVLSESGYKQFKALAAPRGGGKSTISQLVITWAACYGWVRFVFILGANAPKAEERMQGIKEYFYSNDLLLEDFPELCAPVREMGGDPRRAPSNYPWRDNDVRLRNGVRLKSSGIDGAIAGALTDDVRPDFLYLDDTEAGIDVKSDVQVEQLRDRMQEAFALPAQKGTSTIIFVGTIKGRDCVTAEYTDDERNPAWRGERYRALISAPVREDLWGAFMGLLRPADRPGRYTQIADAKLPGTISEEETCDVIGYPLKDFRSLRKPHREAYRLYAANREQMHIGAEVLDPDALPLLRIYGERAILGEKYFLCEMQNDPPPPEDQGAVLQASELRKRQIAGAQKGIVPEWADAVIVTVDIGLRLMHWEASAWNWSGEQSLVIDCGMFSTGLGADGTWELSAEFSRATLMERAVEGTLDRIYEHTKDVYVKATTGEVYSPYGGVDAGGATGGVGGMKTVAWFGTVIRWSAKHRGRWFAMKGSANWNVGEQAKASGKNWYYSPDGFIMTNTQWYKTRLYDSLQSKIYNDDGSIIPGSRSFFSDVPEIYLKHMTAEERNQHDKWVPVGGGHIPNHWWDCAYMATAMADIVRGRSSAPAAVAAKPARKYGRIGNLFGGR